MPSKTLAKILMLISLALFFIKYKIPYINIGISDVFLILSFIICARLFVVNGQKKQALLKYKKLLFFVSGIFFLLFAGTLYSFLTTKNLPFDFIIWEYLRMASALLIFLEIVILGEKDDKFLSKAMLVSLYSLLIIPLVYLSYDQSLRDFFFGPNIARFPGLFKDPNYYALFSILPIILLLELTIMSVKAYAKIIFFLLFSLSAGLFLWSGSRGGFLGIIIGFLVFTLLAGIKSGKKIVFQIIFVIVFGAIIGFVLMPNYAKSEVHNRNTIFLQQKNTPTGTINLIVLNKDQSREALWREGLDYIIKNPIGYGLGYAQIINLVAVGTDSHGNVHNILLEALITGGLGLLTLLLFGLYKLLNPFIKIILNKGVLSMETCMILSAFIGILGASMFLDCLNNKYLWVLAAILLLKIRPGSNDNNDPAVIL